LRPNDLQKTAKKSQTANPKIVRPTNLKYGQISEISLQNGQSGNPGAEFQCYSMNKAVSLNVIMTHESQRLYRKATFSEGFLQS